MLLFTEKPAADSEQYEDIMPFRLAVIDVSKYASKFIFCFNHAQ
jgi:hypothetical protein